MNLSHALAAAALLATVAATPARAVDTQCGQDGAIYSAGRVAFKTRSTTTFFPGGDSFVDIPDAKVRFQIPSGDPSKCVIIRYSAEIVAPAGPTFAAIQVVMNGRKIAEPGPVGYVAATETNVRGAYSFEFVIPDVQPGRTTSIQMQWRAQPTVQIAKWTLTVAY